MLTPEKHMDLDRSVLMVASIILKYMLREKVVKVDKLLSFIENKTGDGVQENFFSALTILYALNKLEYLHHNDTLTLENK